MAWYSYYKLRARICSCRGRAIQIPAICTCIPLFLEVVEHEKNGLIVSLHDSLAIAEAVKRIYDNPEEASEMAKELYKKSESRIFCRCDGQWL
jgi:glycosyltransferase involved in cell wall biosynthesis